MKTLIILAGIYVVLEIVRFIYEVFVIRNRKAMEKNILMLEENLTIANKRIQERDEDINKWRFVYTQLKYEYDEFKNQNHNGLTDAPYNKFEDPAIKELIEEGNSQGQRLMKGINKNFEKE